ncbi:Cell death activator CIDE-B [Operophtera brumata]|uniref:Cell death activator CIDE-B n=1 Tax=Operophtera brumata TaxID=104452 RepID=A0A0L7KP39_OPEBR|nr:Cell death activator CIDE-B [Operophtera brumata]
MDFPSSETMENDNNKPYKICDVNRDKKKGIVALSLEDLLAKVPEKLGLPSENLTVALESDGTEVDDEEYFSTLDPDTSLMILHGNEKWGPNMPRCQVSLDQTDDVALGDKGQVANLVGRLQHNLCHISLLGGQDLELLSDMDPDSLADINSPGEASGSRCHGAVETIPPKCFQWNGGCLVSQTRESVKCPQIISIQ